MLEHGEFKAYGDRVRRVFDGWRREHAPRLRKLAVADSPKDLIRDLSEDLLHRFAGLPLLDRYDVYQCLMDYWDEVMQDDVYLVVTEGWTEAARPRVLVPVKGKGTAEAPDLTVNRKKYRMDLVPPGLVVARYLATVQAEVDRLRTEEERIARELAEFVEEYSGEDGLLEGATSDAGKVTQAAVRARLKAVAGDSAGARQAADGVFRFRRGDSADIVFRIPGLKGRAVLLLEGSGNASAARHSPLKKSGFGFVTSTVCVRTPNSRLFRSSQSSNPSMRSIAGAPSRTASRIASLVK